MAEFLCPRCARPLQPIGGAMVLPEPDPDCVPLPVLICEHCVVRTHFMGGQFDVHPTFYVDEDGQLVSQGEPVDPEVN
jgi:hypothetical protein